MPKKEPRETVPMSEAQREIMEIFWQRGEAGVGEVWRTLSAAPLVGAEHGSDLDHTSGSQGMARA